MSKGQYTYDTTGQSYFFFLTALVVFLLPLTYTTFRGGREQAAARVPVPCEGWNVKSPAVKRGSKGKAPISRRHLMLAVGWIVFAFVVQRANQFEAEVSAYDPFQILGITVGATEKQIKKHYRTLSRTFHPDKVQLSGNQTAEDASNHFIELTKAYKSLTDEDIRRNLELYGHPDGKQEYSQGIALPSWVVESQNIWWVMGAYAAILGVMLPYFVGRWWYGSRRVTKDGVLNTTAGVFFLAVKEFTTFPEMLDILASAHEFLEDSTLVKQRKAIGKAGVDEYARLASTIREGVDGKEGWVGFAGWETGKKRARVLIAAHMLRLPINDLALLREKQTTVSIALSLTACLSSVVLASNWLSTTVMVLHLQQFLLQAVHPSSSPLLQLPYITAEHVKTAKAMGITDVNQFGRLGANEVEKIMVDADEREKKAAFGVAKNWPVIEIVDAKFQVVGEKTVTPGSVVSLTVKLRLAPPGRQHSAPNGVVAVPSRNDGLVEEGAESSIDELIGRRNGEDGEEPNSLVHAPEFPKNRTPTWYLMVGDQKLSRVFVPPIAIGSIGYNKTRTVRTTFPAPGGIGLYTFQLYCSSLDVMGTDAQKDMRMNVLAPPVDQTAEDSDAISEPDEDSLAGAMQALKQQQAGGGGGNASDDTSGTEESSEDDSSSDSDSD